MAFRYRLKSALATVVPHLLILLCSLGAAVIYCHHWPSTPGGGRLLGGRGGSPWLWGIEGAAPLTSHLCHNG